MPSRLDDNQDSEEFNGVDCVGRALSEGDDVMYFMHGKKEGINATVGRVISSTSKLLLNVGNMERYVYNYNIVKINV